MMGEKTIQRNLIISRTHKVSIPNIYLFKWESDLLGLNTSGSLYEYEIKTSIQDFRHDFTKKAKHSKLKIAYNSFKLGKSSKHIVPSFFYYVVPKGLIKPIDVPSYAGLIYVAGDKSKVIKKAPRLTSYNFMNSKHLLKIAVSLSYRYNRYI